MKHFLLLVAALAIVSTAVSAQETFSKGDNLITGQIRKKTR